MNTYHLAAMKTTSAPSTPKRVLCAALILVAATLSACGDKATKEKKPGQALASVNGEEVTVLQLNEELQRAGVTAAQQDTASKQLLQVLIDRQLLQEAAAKENLDRDPKVMQAIDRAKSLIIAQAYLQKRVGNVTKPTSKEVEDYFNAHPEFFSNRKQFSMSEIVIGANDLTPEVRAAADSAKSLEEVAVWMDAHKIKYGRTQITRSTADVPPQLSSKLLGMPKGQLFVVKEGPRAMFISVNEVKDAPVTLAVAAPQIEQFLVNKKNKELASAELQRLRADAKIEYINKSMMPDPKAAPAMPAGGVPTSAVAGADAAPVADQNGGTPAAGAGATPAPAGAPDRDNGTDKAALDRGVAGLK
ncbi:EpsD family peptidyl-prolyl cis-trans isomerase [Massilia norwichensis]|uniref:peptidylprolyl isomerase n=1 Tax=Massilia norwichensis TaxID=1442366 RepID=A0ABT2A568_9BURK|nr:EpsD family peptidyl-prolyl cis-trans isomerase [Massilia norwichensis]MCS0589338.1 EpsD family peptidyl-prolyl cis-trans isomerase [Massilia norwichensis]